MTIHIKLTRMLGISFSMIVTISLYLHLPQVAGFFCFIFYAINDLIILLWIKTTIPWISAHDQGEKPYSDVGLFLWRLNFIRSGLKFNAASQILEKQMLQFLLCLFGLHGATEMDYTVDNEEIKVCRDCLKEVE